MNQDKVQWRAVVKTVMNNLIPKREEGLFETGHSFLEGLYYRTLYVCQHVVCAYTREAALICALTSGRGRIDITCSIPNVDT